MGTALSRGDEFRLALNESHREAAERGKKQGYPVLSVARLTHNTVAVTFDTTPPPGAEGPARLGLVPGGHISIRSDKGFSRSYTPYIVDNGSFTVMVKIYPKGRVSPYLGSVRSGDFVITSAPIEPQFSVVGLKASTLILVGGGTGIAPIYSMAEHIVRRQGNTTVVHVFGCFRNEDEVLLGIELCELREQFPDTMQVCFVFSQPLQHASASFQGVLALHGRFGSNNVLRHLPSPAAIVPAMSYVVACGPPGFGITIGDLLEQHLRIPPENITLM